MFLHEARGFDPSSDKIIPRFQLALHRYYSKIENTAIVFFFFLLYVNVLQSETASVHLPIHFHISKPSTDDSAIRGEQHRGQSRRRSIDGNCLDRREHRARRSPVGKSIFFFHDAAQSRPARASLFSDASRSKEKAVR